MMKYLIFPTLALTIYTASAQSNQPLQSILAKKEEILQQVQYQGVTQKNTSRNDSNFRLDSILYFDEYTGLDSTKYQTGYYAYEGDTLITNTLRIFNEFAGVWVNSAQYVLGFDAYGRNDYFEYKNVAGPEFQTQYYQETFFRFPEGEEKDSIRSFQRNITSNEIYNDYRILNYQYNAKKQETLREHYINGTNAVPVIIFRFASVYDNNDRLDSVLYSSAPIPMPFTLNRMRDYHYSGDTTFYYEAEYIGPNSWKPLERGTTISNTFGSPVFMLTEVYDEVSQTWKKYQTIERTYDAENRVITWKSSVFDFGGIPVIAYEEYGYIHENQNKYLFAYFIDNVTGDLVPRYKQYYFYSDLSGTDVQQQQESVVSISPNPATDHIRIDAPGSTIDRIEVYNLSGRMVRSQQGFGSTVVHFSRGDLNVGTFLVKVITDEGIMVQKVVFR